MKLDLDDKDEGGIPESLHLDRRLTILLPAPNTDKRKTRRSKKAREPSPRPPDIDRAGEMPAGSEPVVKAKKTTGDMTAKHKEGLRGIDIGADARPSGGADSPRVPLHFEEYRDDEADDVTAAGTPTAEPVAVASSDVQVVRVKRKKKKVVDGSGKKKSEA